MVQVVWISSDGSVRGSDGFKETLATAAMEDRSGGNGKRCLPLQFWMVMGGRQKSHAAVNYAVHVAHMQTVSAPSLAKKSYHQSITEGE